jgi:archaellum component FlaC
MAEEPTNIIIEMLRRQNERFNKLDDKLDRVIGDLHDVKVRLTGVEEGLNVVQRRIDRLEDRVERIEKRLELAGPAGFAE